MNIFVTKPHIRWREDSVTGIPLEIVCPKGSNFHGHLGTGPIRQATGFAAMRSWKHLVVMPDNNQITTIEKMITYRDACLRLRDDARLETNLIMTLYLTPVLTPRVIERMAKLGFVCAVKYCPLRGATNGKSVALGDAHETLTAMGDLGIRLLGHFESIQNREGDVLPHERREGYFMEHEFPILRDTYPELSINIEHATTELAIMRVKDDPTGKTTCSITPQAMLHVREHLNMLSWGNHAKSMPVPKTAEDRAAVLAFALSGDFRAHLGDASVACPSKMKLVPYEQAAWGCYMPHSFALTASIFAQHKMLENFPAFACFNGPDTWGLERPSKTEDVILFQETESDIPAPVIIPGTDDEVVPFGYSKGSDALHIGYKLFC